MNCMKWETSFSQTVRLCGKRERSTAMFVSLVELISDLAVRVHIKFPTIVNFYFNIFYLKSQWWL